jgi:hypothetical protein
MATLEQDMRIIVDHINAQLPDWPQNETEKLPYYDPEVHLSMGHDIRGDGSKVKARHPCWYVPYYAEHSHCVRVIEEWFREDIERLGFSYHGTCEGTEGLAKPDWSVP